MGNAATKESRSSQEHSARHSRGGSTASTAAYDHYRPSDGIHASSPRALRGGRSDFALLGLGAEREPVEHRRETRQEREARKREKENAARIKERQRSMKEEHVDGGYLVTQGVYVGTEDFNKAIVRQLMIERRLAPFWRGLNDFSESWTEHQLMAAARGMPIPAPDEVPPELEYKIPSKSSAEKQPPERNLNTLMVPITSRSQSYNSDTSSINRTISPARSPGALSPTNSFLRGRAKTLASLTTSSKTPASDMAPRELQLPKDPFVNGQPIEAYLYKDASECPICFLYYPPYLNKTRCCDQPICSECFVQIKRPDPHPPEHHDPNNSETTRPDEAEGQLVSEPAACPFCVQPEFGVMYTPPPFRRGLAYAASPGVHALANSSAASSASSLVSGGANPGTRRRAVSISADSPSVITTDRVRPDWATKLAAARAQAARRSAAATALHTAASRRSRIDELEEMMMMEAIRLSLAAEEERRKKEEKETRKEAKRREKEAKKAEKSAKKAGLDSQNPSNLTSSTSSANSAVQTAGGANSELDMSANKGKGVDRSEPRPGVSTEAGSSTEPPKITIKDLKGEQFSSMLEGSSKNMHLRHVSSASSSNSSLVESAFGESIGSGTPHNGSSSSLAAIHGFRSLAAMIDDTPSGDSGESMNRPGSTNEQVQGAPAVKEPSENSAPNEPDQVTLLSSSPSLEQKDTLGKEVHMSSAEVLPQSSLGTAS
ncbi:hypothetical protein CIHG_08177 [Coccidioides immitis H538.4]|uniref:Protein SIP5 n=1 Tax=Coccidioides immitis H538.4 TaxID=396776 RepID=A0A0J8RZU5_COCIT|nr:hypothetical protein CIHG_08177 [Coccidioides immitis H538.4]